MIGPAPGSLPAAGQAAARAPAVSGVRAGAGLRTPAATLPLADLLALGLALAMAGLSLLTIGYAAAILVLLSGHGLHRVRICLRLSDQVGRILTAVALPLPVLLPWLPGRLAWHMAMWSAGLLLTVRAATYAGLRAARSRGILADRTLVVGAGEMGILVASSLLERPELGLDPIGFLDTCPPPDSDLPLPLVGAATDLPVLVGRLQARRVIVCFPVDRDRELVSVVRACRSLPAEVSLVPRLQELGMVVPRASLDDVWGIPLLTLRRDSRAAAMAKRAADVVIAGVLLLLLWPVILILAAAVRLDSGGPSFFRQVRVTGPGRTSRIVKLRTLAAHADSDTCWQLPPGRCTPFGRWLRESHLDELPQLVNVLRGEMSLVGPRPERPYFADRFALEIPHYQDRTRVRAGLTGWAQANGLRGDTSMRARVRFDNQYIEYWSPWLDAVVMARTLVAMIRHRSGGTR